LNFLARTDKPIIVLAMHGASARDFPREELTEWRALHSRLRDEAPVGGVLKKRYADLYESMRRWPRTPQNDPYFFASTDLASEIARQTGLEVKLGFNEFCAPSMEEALDEAAAESRHVIVVTSMLTAGGSHAEHEIPQSIDEARARHPEVCFQYAWPFAVRDTAAFLAAQVRRIADEPSAT